jgi:hypothetical protein
MYTTPHSFLNRTSMPQRGPDYRLSLHRGCSETNSSKALGGTEAVSIRAIRLKMFLLFLIVWGCVRLSHGAMVEASQRDAVLAHMGQHRSARRLGPAPEAMPAPSHLARHLAEAWGIGKMPAWRPC